MKFLGREFNELVEIESLVRTFESETNIHSEKSVEELLHELKTKDNDCDCGCEIIGVRIRAIFIRILEGNEVLHNSCYDHVCCTNTN